MRSTPFIYGTTVSVKSFTNREDEIAKLSSNLTQGINTTIISPRRWGKSSLVEKVIQNINEKDKKIKIVVLDLFSVSNESELLEIFAREIIKSSSTKWEDWVTASKSFFKQLAPTISLGANPVNDLSLSFNSVELQKHKDEILNLPEVIAKKKKIKFIICLDEFQNLANFSDFTSLENKMRAVWQRQKHVTYCLYGSKRHMMADIFDNPSKPFYRFGDMMLLQKISAEKWLPFIKNSFKRTSKSIKIDDAKLIPEIMKNHSWYVQQLAHYTWQKTEKMAKRKNIVLALKELIGANTPLYQKEIEVISPTQLNLLKAVVNKERQLTSMDVMQKYHLGTPNNVRKNKVILMNNDVIHETKEGYELLDPAFELWFLNQFFNVDIYQL